MNEQTLQKLKEAGELFSPGHRACIGCVEVLAVRQICKALGKDTIIANATGCMQIVSSPLPTTNWMVPWIHTLFENTAAVASGIEAGLKAMRRKGTGIDRDITVVAMGGDGATADIGLQALSGALERGHKFLYVCFDNEAYMNTGIQRSSTTPFGASTTTSPSGKTSIGKVTWKKDMPAIAAAHNIPYVATACPSYSADLVKKVKKAQQADGPAYLHVFSVCPTGWRAKPEIGLELGRLAVETGIFPLYEIENGRWKMTKTVQHLKPVQEYLKHQGRFRHLTPDMVARIQDMVTSRYQTLLQKCGIAPS
ncbi:MAG: pyruvate synthase subunit PorB [Desulfobacterota bacterium]|nr:pyruvate synthase subunit PorB [Thermodesulfobacteriota bacterium]